MLSSAPPSESDSKVHRATNNPPLHFIWAPVASPRNIPHFTAAETLCYLLRLFLFTATPGCKWFIKF